MPRPTPSSLEYITHPSKYYLRPISLSFGDRTRVHFSVQPPAHMSRRLEALHTFFAPVGAQLISLNKLSCNVESLDNRLSTSVNQTLGGINCQLGTNKR